MNTKMPLEFNEREIVIFYNSARKKGRNTLAIAKSMTNHVREWDILHDPPTPLQLRRIMELLNTDVEGLIERDSAVFHEKYEDVILTEDEWLDVLHHNPDMIQEPIAFMGKRGIIIETPSNVLNLDPSHGFNDMKT